MKKILILSLFAIGVLSFAIVPAKTQQVFSDVLTQLLKNLNRFGEERPEDRVYLHFDKPFYKPGEDIWFSAYVRNGESMKASEKSGIVRVELINPKGSVEKELKIITKNGVAKGDFHLDEYAVGGLYKVKAYTNWQKNDKPPAFFEKEIQVQKVILPRLKMKLDFMKKAYGAGDEAAAELTLNDNTNKPLANYDFDFVVNLEGKQLVKSKGTTGSEGEALVKFKLPKNLKSNDGLLNVMIQYQGQTESISRSVPIVLNNVEVALYPEGGDLVAGLPGRVAFKASNEFGKPADVQGIVEDSKGNKIADFSSFHQGMGAFKITPKADETYTVKITKPVGVVKTFEVPEAMEKGYGLEVRSVKKDNIHLSIHSTQEEELYLIATVRGKQYFASRFDAIEGSRITTIPTAKFPMGVAQITLFDSKGIERAERLAFVNKHKQLNIDIKTNKEKYQPREKVKMTVKVTDERGMPMPGNLSLAVADDQLLSFADDKSSNILSWLLLEADIKDKVEEPNFYFDETEEKADQALDYLLMTSGWRRFSWEEIRNNAMPPIAHVNESNIIGGRVTNAARGHKPFAGVTVKDNTNNKTVITDSEGRFSFKDVDLSQPVSMTISAKGFRSQNFFLSNYNANLNYTLYKAPIPRPRMPMAKRSRRMPVPVDAAVNERPILAVEDVEEEEMEQVLEPEPMLRAEHASALMEVEDDDFDDGAGEALMENKNIEEKEAKKAKEVVVEKEILAQADKIVLRDVRFKEKAKKDMPAKKPMAGRRQAAQSIYYRARQFAAPTYQSTQQVEKRTDFRSTIYWNGNVELDRKGKATIEFYNSDVISSFNVTAEGIAADGMVGRGEHKFYTQMPFSISAKLPVEVITQDVLKIPLTLVNNTERTVKGALEITIPKGLEPMKTLPTEITLAANQATTKYLPFRVVEKTEQDKIAVSFKTRGFHDIVEQDLTIIPVGFPVEMSFSGSDLDKAFEVMLNNPVANSVKAQVTAYPSTVNEMMSGLESMIRKPSGCFEQTSSATFPNIFVLNYLQETEQANPQVTKRARQFIEAGYKRLTGYECKEGGFEWFGRGAGHEGLTAYGIMEFVAMQKVWDGVDQTMIDRTIEWLMSRKTGQGGFQRNPHALHAFGKADMETMDLYITWALSEAGYEDIKTEVEYAYNVAMKTKNPYHLGMVSNTLYNRGDTERGKETLDELMNIQLETGQWEHNNKDRSAPGSNGVSLRIATAGLAARALIKEQNPHVQSLRKCMDFIKNSRNSYGGFGTTNSTVLALWALTDYANYNKKTNSSGTIEVYVGNKKVKEQAYEKGEKDEIVIDGLEAFLKDGKQKISVKYAGTSAALPYSLGVNYYQLMPNTAKECVVKLDAKLASTKIKVGETVRLTTKVTNTTTEGQPMTMAIVGLPSGLSPQPWQLKELSEKMTIDFYEVIGNNVIFYFRDMAPSEVHTINLDLKADIAGTYNAPASSAYLYYTDEYKYWTRMNKVVIREN